MKKQFLLFLLALLPVVASAQDAVEIDGIYYKVITKAKVAEVTKNSSGYYTGSVDIPASVIYEGVEYSVTTIGEYAFSGCSGLTSVTIPNSVTSIGESAFYKCSSLTSVHISDVAAWCKISFGGSNSNPLYYAHHLYIGENEITDLVIPNSVTSIGSFAFYSCSGLTSVTIPNSVTSIGNWAFAGCSSLTSVTIPNSVTSIGNYAFNACSGLTAVTIPGSVTSIGDWAFGTKSIMTVKSYIEEPVSLKKPFGQDTYSQGKLIVPRGTKELYARCDGWKEFRLPTWGVIKKAMKKPLVIDGRNIFDIEVLEENDFEYHCIGK